MLEGKVNLNLQNDFLVNRNKTASNNQPQKQNTEVHDKKSKIFWSAAGAAALIATVTGGIYYLRRGKASAELDEVINTLGEEVAHFEPAQSFLNKKFNFDFAESLFSKFKAEILETPEKIVIGKQENQLTHIIKNSIDDRRIIKFNEDKSFIQVINGDNILNIYRPADGEFSQISELFIGDSIIPVVNKQGKKRYYITKDTINGTPQAASPGSKDDILKDTHKSGSHATSTDALVSPYNIINDNSKNVNPAPMIIPRKYYKIFKGMTSRHFCLRAV